MKHKHTAQNMKYLGKAAKCWSVTSLTIVISAYKITFFRNESPAFVSLLLKPRVVNLPPVSFLNCILYVQCENG